MDDLDVKLNEMAKRQTKIEDTQELLSRNLSELCARIEAIETRSRVRAR